MKNEEKKLTQNTHKTAKKQWVTPTFESASINLQTENDTGANGDGFGSDS